MGKRSDFLRIDKDAYQTIDPRAVSALEPHLSPNASFAEPCVGDGLLRDRLLSLSLDLQCAYEGDINLGRDALNLSDDDLIECDLIITNPPWSRPILHRMINHFSSLRPTWLLFDADWVHTKQSAPLMSRLSKIVSVGRLRWISGTTMQGKDNCAWYLFDARHSGSVEFFGRAVGGSLKYSVGDGDGDGDVG